MFEWTAHPQCVMSSLVSLVRCPSAMQKASGPSGNVSNLMYGMSATCRVFKLGRCCSMSISGASKSICMTCTCSKLRILCRDSRLARPCAFDSAKVCSVVAVLAISKLWPLQTPKPVSCVRGDKSTCDNLDIFSHVSMHSWQKLGMDLVDMIMASNIKIKIFDGGKL